MSDIEIKQGEYPVICEIHGCGNITSNMIGKPGENPGSHKIICPECLQNIINAAPLEMILNRPELAEVEEDEVEELENVGKALEGEEVLTPMCFDEMSFKELKQLAIEKGLEFKVGMSKMDLVNYLEGEK